MVRAGAGTERGSRTPCQRMGGCAGCWRHTARGGWGRGETVKVRAVHVSEIRHSESCRRKPARQKACHLLTTPHSPGSCVSSTAHAARPLSLGRLWPGLHHHTTPLLNLDPCRQQHTQQANSTVSLEPLLTPAAAAAARCSASLSLARCAALWCPQYSRYCAPALLGVCRGTAGQRDSSSMAQGHGRGVCLGQSVPIA